MMTTHRPRPEPPTRTLIARKRPAAAVYLYVHNAPAKNTSSAHHRVPLAVATDDVCAHPADPNGEMASTAADKVQCGTASSEREQLVEHGRRGGKARGHNVTQVIRRADRAEET
ncbi:hypothetical protein VTO73DRAFT_12889 [Trametes versicolor]